MSLCRSCWASSRVEASRERLGALGEARCAGWAATNEVRGREALDRSSEDPSALHAGPKTCCRGQGVSRRCSCCVDRGGRSASSVGSWRLSTVENEEVSVIKGMCWTRLCRAGWTGVEKEWRGGSVHGRTARASRFDASQRASGRPVQAIRHLCSPARAHAVEQRRSCDEAQVCPRRGERRGAQAERLACRRASFISELKHKSRDKVRAAGARGRGSQTSCLRQSTAPLCCVNRKLVMRLLAWIVRRTCADPSQEAPPRSEWTVEEEESSHDGGRTLLTPARSGELVNR